MIIFVINSVKDLKRTHTRLYRLILFAIAVPFINLVICCIAAFSFISYVKLKSTSNIKSHK